MTRFLSVAALIAVFSGVACNDKQAEAPAKAEETATTKAESTLHSVRFWKACQAGKSPNDALITAGFEIDFEPTEERSVQNVTLRLNQTWMSILQRVLDRKK